MSESAAQPTPERINETNIVISYDTVSRLPRVKALFNLLGEYVKDDKVGVKDEYHLEGKYQGVIDEVNSLFRTIRELVFYAGKNKLGTGVMPAVEGTGRTPYEEHLNLSFMNGMRSFIPGGYQALTGIVMPAIDAIEKEQTQKLKAALDNDVTALKGEDLVLLLQEFARRERLLGGFSDLDQ